MLRVQGTNLLGDLFQQGGDGLFFAGTVFLTYFNGLDVIGDLAAGNVNFLVALFDNPYARQQRGKALINIAFVIGGHAPGHLDDKP